MTVAELIDALQTLPPSLLDLPIMFSNGTEELPIVALWALNTGSWDTGGSAAIFVSAFNNREHPAQLFPPPKTKT